MNRQSSIKEWVMVTCDFNVEKPLESYNGFCVMKISNKKTWTNEVARFYEGDPYEDYDTALAYADSISRTVLKSCYIEDFWKRIGRSPRRVNKNG